MEFDTDSINMDIPQSLSNVKLVVTGMDSFVELDLKVGQKLKCQVPFQFQFDTSQEEYEAEKIKIWLKHFKNSNAYQLLI